MSNTYVPETLHIASLLQPLWNIFEDQVPQSQRDLTNTYSHIALKRCHSGIWTWIYLQSSHFFYLICILWIQIINEYLFLYTSEKAIFWNNVLATERSHILMECYWPNGPPVPCAVRLHDCLRNSKYSIYFIECLLFSRLWKTALK